MRKARRWLAVSGPRQVRSEGDFQRVSIPTQDADILRDLLLVERPVTVIEIGLAYGSSALAVAEALLSLGSDQARHVIIDAFQHHFGDEGWATITEAGLEDLCKLIRERSQVALPRLLAEGFVADAAFVDGSHIFHNVFVDLAYLSDLVRPGGVVIMDDCDLPSVATAVRYFELNVGWTAESIAWPTRLRAFRIPDPKPASSEVFRPFDSDNTDEPAPRGH